MLHVEKGCCFYLLSRYRFLWGLRVLTQQSIDATVMVRKDCRSAAILLLLTAKRNLPVFMVSGRGHTLQIELGKWSLSSCEHFHFVISFLFLFYAFLHLIYFCNVFCTMTAVVDTFRQQCNTSHIVTASVHFLFLSRIKILSSVFWKRNKNVTNFLRIISSIRRADGNC